MKTLLALVAAAGLVVSPALAAEPDPAAAAAQSAADAVKQAEAAAAKAAVDAMNAAEALKAQDAAAQAPKGLPVPSDLPVISKKEIEGGIIIEELKIGDGYEVQPGGAVVAHYHGTLKADGKKFDSSFERGEPIAFPLSGVIAGWQKGVPGMKVGGIRRLTIPSAMGYGERGAGADIPPNSDLVFVIQLVDALQIEDKTVGTGEEVGPRPISVTAYTMTGADGKEIEKATKDAPFIWVPGEHQGVGMGLEGMKVGGKRTLKIPAQMNVTNPGAPNPHNRPSNVPVTVEIELIAVKNLVPPTPKK